MKLLDVINTIAGIAESRPNVGLVIKDGDIYKLNTYNDVQYPAIAIGQEQHSYDDENGLMTYNFILYYADRLKADESNMLMVQSDAIECLRAVLTALEDQTDIDINTINFNVYNQRFNDVCAGAYTNVSVSLPVDSCYDNFD